MAINDILGLTVELEADTDKFVRDLQKAAGKVQMDFDAKPLVKRFSGAQKDIKSIFAKTVAEAATVGLGRSSIERFTKKLQPLSDQIESSMRRVFDLQIKTREKGISEIVKQERKAALELEESKLVGLKKRFDFERKATDNLLERRKQAIQEAERLAARTRAEAAEEFSEGISKAFDSLKSGDFGSVLKGLGKGAEAKGLGMKAGAAGQEGKLAKAADALGTILSKIGPALLAIGALAAGFGMLVKMVLDADSAMKQLNRTMFESGIAAGDITDGFDGLGDAVNTIRKTFTTADGAFSFNSVWGTTAKDHLEILGAYAKAGLTFKELKNGMSQAADVAERLRDGMEAALTYANLLGTSNVEMAENIAAYMEDLGSTIDGVERSLSAVHMAARESGFGVKRFFNMVLQATSGMSMYNVRLEEASGLLIRLGQILGSRMGGDFLQQLTKGFGDESMQDRYKRVMTTGAGRTQKTFQRSALNTADDFKKALVNAKLGEKFAEAASDAGVSVNFEDSKQMVKDLGALTKDQQTRLLTEAREADPALAKRLTNLIQVSQGARGGVGRMAESLGGLDMGGKLMMQLQQGQAVLEKSLHEMSTVELMAFENITGISGEQLEQLRRISQGMTGSYEKLSEVAKQGYGDKTDEEILAAQVEQVKAHGAYVSADGKVIAARLDETGEAIDTMTEKVLENFDFNAYVQSQGHVYDEAAKQALGRDTLLAQEMVAKTTDIAKIMEQGVEFWLEMIHSAVNNILQWLKSKGETGAAKEAMGQVEQEMRDLRGKEKERNEEIAALKSQRVGAPEGEREKLDTRLRELEKAATADRAAMEDRATEMRALQDLDLRSWYNLDPNRTAEQLRATVKSGDVNVPGIDPERVEALRAKVGERFVTSSREAAERRPVVPESFFGKFSWDQIWNSDAIAEGRGKQAEEQARKIADFITAQLVSGGSAQVPEIQGPLRDDETLRVALQEGADETASQMEGMRAQMIKEQVEEEKRAKEEHKQGEGALKKLTTLPSEIVKEQQKAQVEAGLRDLFPNAGDKKLSRMVERVISGRGGGQGVRKAFAGASEDVQERIRKGGFGGRLGWLEGAPAAKDFLLQIGDGGQVKFAQRIDSADQVTAVAAKAGGAISGAARGGGKGGVTIVQHNYSDMEAIKKGWRALRAARAV